MSQQVPAVDYLVLDDEPHLQAWACTHCQALYFDRRNACARCCATEFTRRPLAREGVVRAFTRVERGAREPFTSVVVDLLGGGTVKANLVGLDDVSRIRPDLKVRLRTFVVDVDDDGVEAVAFGFEPVGGAA